MCVSVWLLLVCVMDQLIIAVFYLSDHKLCLSANCISCLPLILQTDSSTPISWLRGWEMSHMLLISFTHSFTPHHPSFISLIFTNMLFYLTLFQQYIHPFLQSMTLCLLSTSPASYLSFIHFSQFTSYIDILRLLLLSSVIFISN